MGGDVHADLRGCQRFYEKSYNLNVAPGTTSSYVGSSYVTTSSANINSGASNVYYKVTKRVTPTHIVYSPATGATGVGAWDNDASNVSLNTANQGVSGSSVYPQQNIGANQYVKFQWVADAEL